MREKTPPIIFSSKLILHYHPPIFKNISYMVRRSYPGAREERIFENTLQKMLRKTQKETTVLLSKLTGLPPEKIEEYSRNGYIALSLLAEVEFNSENQEIDGTTNDNTQPNMRGIQYFEDIFDDDSNTHEDEEFDEIFEAAALGNAIPFFLNKNFVSENRISVKGFSLLLYRRSLKDDDSYFSIEEPIMVYLKTNPKYRKYVPHLMRASFESIIKAAAEKEYYHTESEEKNLFSSIVSEKNVKKAVKLRADTPWLQESFFREETIPSKTFLPELATSPSVETKTLAEVLELFERKNSRVGIYNSQPICPIGLFNLEVSKNMRRAIRIMLSGHENKLYALYRKGISILPFVHHMYSHYLNFQVRDRIIEIFPFFKGTYLSKQSIDLYRNFFDTVNSRYPIFLIEPKEERFVGLEQLLLESIKLKIENESINDIVPVFHHSTKHEYIPVMIISEITELMEQVLIRKVKKRPNPKLAAENFAKKYIEPLIASRKTNQPSEEQLQTVPDKVQLQQDL